MLSVIDVPPAKQIVIVVPPVAGAAVVSVVSSEDKEVVEVEVEVEVAPAIHPQTMVTAPTQKMVTWIQIHSKSQAPGKMA